MARGESARGCERIPGALLRAGAETFEGRRAIATAS